MVDAVSSSTSSMYSLLNTQSSSEEESSNSLWSNLSSDLVLVVAAQSLKANLINI